MRGNQQKAPMLFLDFDGTISSRDAIDAILEAYADPEWLAIEEEWQAGRIGSRDCLSAQMALVDATPDELDALLASIKVDQGLGLLLETCATHNIPTYIISDGFDYCIRRILARGGSNIAHRLRDVRIFSNQLDYKDGRWRVDFPHSHLCEHGCATCKPAVMRFLNPANAPAIFVGDGLSDRYAAANADLVYAKKSLAAYCREQAIAHVLYDNLDDVARHLEAALLKPQRDGGKEKYQRESTSKFKSPLMSQCLNGKF